MAAKPRKTPSDGGVSEHPKIFFGEPNEVDQLVKNFATSDRDLIAQTLRQIMQDTTAPAAARAQAARTMAEMVGALGRHAAPPAEEGKPLAEMTRAELEAELARS